MHKALFGILLAVALAGAEPVALPTWFTSRSIPSEGRLVGFGAGQDLPQARLAALSDLAEQLVVSITSERSLDGRQAVASNGPDAVTVEQNQDYRQAIRSSSTVRDLAGVEVIKQEVTSTGSLVAVGVERQRLTSQFGDRIAVLDRLLAGGQGERPQVPDAAWVARLRALLASAIEREALAAALLGQGSAPPPSPLAAAVLRTNLGGLARPVLLQCEGDVKAVDGAVATVAGDLGLAVAPQGATHTLRGKQDRVDGTSSRGWAKVVLSVDVSIVTMADNRTIGCVHAEAAATSTKDADQAARQAGEELSRRLTAEFRSKLLLILLRNRMEP